MIDTLARFPLTVALLAAHRREDWLTGLDVEGVASAIARGESTADLGWSLEFGRFYPLRRCAELLLIRAIRSDV